MKKHGDLRSFVDRYTAVNKEIEKAKEPIKAVPSQVINIGEKYELVTGIDEGKAANLNARLLPNLHNKWIPSEEGYGGRYNKELYKSSEEQEFYEEFIQPLFKIYKEGQFHKHVDAKENILRHNWDKKVNIEALGPEKALFQKADGSNKSVSVGEIEVTLILVTHFISDLYKYNYRRIARRFGATVGWVGAFRKRIQSVYGKMASISLEEHLDRQLGRCEGILDTFVEKARDGDHYAAKVVKEFMDKEDQYIMPTLEQLPVKDTPEEREETLKRIKKIVSDSLEAKKIEGKTVTDIERIETTPEMIKEAFKYQKEKDKNE